MRTSSPTIDVRLPWLESHHSFSFSRHVPEARIAYLFVARGALTFGAAGRLRRATPCA